jgi:hypothetical protein
METVTINITRASVLADMKVKVHAATASIADDKARYLAQLGSEREQEAHQCITDASLEVATALRRLLTGFPTQTETAGDAYDTTATITYVLTVSQRKSKGLAKFLAQAIHAYLVDSALSKYYVSVNHAELAAPHLAALAVQKSYIESLCYTKTEPSIPS